MALSPQLLQFKSSGVYRLEFDKSQTANIDVSTLRLVVGHSRKGPYNTPVLIENVEAFIQVYGNIDKSLEKKGMFFHRSAKAALSRGPILALNLAHFGENDLASAAQISTNGSYKTDPLMERPAGNTWVEGDVKVAYVAPAITNTLTLASLTVASGISGQGVEIVGEDFTGSISTNDYLLQSDGTVAQITGVSFSSGNTMIGIAPSSDVLDASYIGATTFDIYNAGTEEQLYTEAEYLADFTIATYPELGHQTGDYAYANFFDTDKFMIPSDEKVLQTLGQDSNQVLNFVNIKQTPITVFTRKAQDTAGFDVTAREWYGEGNVPAYLDNKDLMSDYMIDVFVFKGKFDAAAMDTDPVYGYYFDNKGLRKELIEQFANLRQVEMIGSYTGSMLPGFKDLEGRNVYIETMINAEARRTGLFCAIAEDLVTDESGDTPIDLVGHTFDEAAQDQVVLSYDIANRTILFPGSDLTYSADGTNAIFTYTGALSTFNPEVKKGNYIRTGERLALVEQVSVSKNESEQIVWTIKLSEAAPLVAPTAFVESLEDAAVSYTPFVLNGADIEAETITSCLQAISLGTGLATGLVDKDAIDFRYIVDTFGSYDLNGLQNKIQLSQLAKERQNAAAILNAPMVKDFKESTDPSFKDQFGSFKTSYIKDGGNLDQNPTSLYTLPSIADGANFAFYYGPGLIVRENGKDLIVPPAAYVSNNYIDKYTDALPWSIVAGPRRGVVAGTNVAGAEYSFDKSDRDILEPFGYNPIVFQRGVGLTILGNKTAQQSIKSSLSSAHVREVLIYIQDAMADILKDYVFEFNNAQTRLEIKTLADSLMESVRQDGGVYDFKNVMDQSNNTGEVIDNNIGIIDTFVEPVKGLEIVVHRTTILNTGEISTGNFS
jgi:hypothetical protein